MLSDKIKKLRLKNDLQQKDLVEYLKVAKSTYSQYESGDRTPDLETLKKIANFYNVSVDFLLDNHEPSLEEQKQLIKDELGDDAFALFKRLKNATPEQLKYIKLILDADDENETD